MSSLRFDHWKSLWFFLYEIQYRVPTTHWKIWLGACWPNIFDFLRQKNRLKNPQNILCHIQCSLATSSDKMQGHYFLTLALLHFKRTALKIHFKIIHALLCLHTSWYYKLIYLLLLKKRKWNIIQYQTTFLWTVISSPFCYYLVGMLKFGTWN